MNKAMSFNVFSGGKICLKTRIKWFGFNFLEWLSDLHRKSTIVDSPHLDIANKQHALWVFVSTIGELNAIDPFLKRLVACFPRLKLVLITDHSHYIESYRSNYPESVIQVIHGHRDEARKLAEISPPELLVVGEIPCWPSDAPCRFSFAFVMEAKRLGARTCIVNAWLYYYQPSCRMDYMERKLFQADYLQLFDLIATQTDEIRTKLIEHGANAATVHTVGNLKFDTLIRAKWNLEEARSSQLLGLLIKSRRPLVVAGCITNLSDQHFILDAFQNIRLSHPSALLVIAPRHPEVTQRMQLLEEFLKDRAIPYVFRSRIADEAVPSDITCLVLDTMGELRDFYAIAHVAHVGVNHNVLEPLAFGKPVTVQAGWDETYPSYPVFRLMHDRGGLILADSPEELGSIWKRLLESPEEYANTQTKIDQIIKTLNGSLERLWRRFEPLLPPQN